MKNIYKKRKGNLVLAMISLGLYFILFIICMFVFTKYKINSEIEIVSDALISSNLASFTTKNLDLGYISSDPNKDVIVIKEPQAALNTFKRHLQYNLALDNNLKPLNSISFIKSTVKIEKFIIYNVYENNDVVVYELTTGGNFQQKNITNGRNNLFTPKGSKIEESTIHSQISFTLNHLFNKSIIVYPNEDTDIIKE